MMQAAAFGAAVALDGVVGDPRWAPHPVQAIGAVIDACDRYASQRGWREGPYALLAGAVTALGVVGGVYALSTAIEKRLRTHGPYASVVLAASTLACRSLLHEAAHVEHALSCGDLDLARLRLARVVGRDTAHLDQTGIARAAVETLAESFCDGIVAPLFYLMIGGAPLALAYKAANTLDSMIGHYEAPYRHFGRFAAKLDDAANYVPARLSACALILCAQCLHGTGLRSLRTAFADAFKHASPNAGWPEAAMAGALGVRLGGRNTYAGAAKETPLLGAHFAGPCVTDIRRAMTLVLSGSMLVAVAGWLLLRKIGDA